MIKIKTFLLATLLLTGLVFPATAQIGEPRRTSLLVSMEVST